MDATGSAYLTGYTGSSDFPTPPGAFDPNFNGNGDALCLRASSTRLAAGLAMPPSWAAAIDNGASASPWIQPAAPTGGSTCSSDFPTTPGAFDPSYNARTRRLCGQAEPDRQRLSYSTFLGGSSEATPSPWTAGSAYVTGWTYSNDFPAKPGAFDPSYQPSVSDAFVAKLEPGRQRAGLRHLPGWR